MSVGWRELTWLSVFHHPQTGLSFLYCGGCSFLKVARKGSSFWFSTCIMFVIILLAKASQRAKPHQCGMWIPKGIDRKGNYCSHFCKQSIVFGMDSIPFRILIFVHVCSIPQKEVPKKQHMTFYIYIFQYCPNQCVHTVFMNNRNFLSAQVMR